MEITGIDTINKLILLFILDKMEVSVTENTIIEIATVEDRERAAWLTYMDCKHTLGLLLEAGFVYRSEHEKNSYFSITADGRMCLSHFYQRIPVSVRSEITEFIKENRMNLKRRQEYFRNYYKNADGSYTVVLKIIDPVMTTLEIKLNVANRSVAKQAYDKWEEKAASVYFNLHEQLIE